MQSNIRNEIIDISKKQKVGDIGFLKASKFDDLEEILVKRGKVSLVCDDFKKRTNPYFIMPDVKSIIVCLFSYHKKYPKKISSYAQGQDYHNVVKGKLLKIANPLIKYGYKAEVFCDNGDLSDRFLAMKCGLGFVGKNGMLINEKLGSEFFIGYIMTDCEFIYDVSLKNQMCIGCNKCIKACPGGAIGEDFGFNENLCISFLTQKKGELSKEEESIIRKSGYIWGCDICNMVCPYNENAPVTEIKEFMENDMDDISIDDNITNKEFKKIYAKKAFSWRGKNVILRNINLYK